MGFPSCDRFRPLRRVAGLFCSGWIAWSPVHAAPPANDPFANRFPVVGAEATLAGDVTEATAEPGEPAPADSAGHSLWWTWTPTEDGLLRLSGQGVISVFRGEALDALQELRTERFYPPAQPGGEIIVVGNSDPDAWINDLIPVEAGVAYQFRLDSNECTFRPPIPPPFPGGPLIPITPSCAAFGTNLWLQFVAYPAAGDSFAGRREVIPTEPLFFARNDQATQETGEPATLSGAGRSVWWSWTVPATGRYAMDSVANQAMSVAVFRGDQLDQLEPVTDRTVTPTIIRAWGSDPRPKFFARAGEKLAIRGDALPDRPTNAPIAFRFRLLPRPANDDLADALVLTNLTDTMTAYGEAEFSGATAEPGETPAAVRSAWWRWTAPVSGNWAVGPARIYLGDPMTPLTAVELSHETSVPRLAAEAGRTYLVSLDAQEGEEDFLTLRFRFVRVPSYDDPGHPLELSLGPDPIRLGMAGTSVMSEEPWATNGFNRSVWLQWRAPSDGYLVLRPMTSFETKVLVGTKTDFAGGNPAGANAFYFVPATFPVTSGTTYLISLLTGPYPQGDEIELAADFTSRCLAQPADGAVFPSGASNLTAELAPAADPDETAIIGVHWQLSPVLSDSIPLPEGPTPSVPQLAGDVASWSDLPSGLWVVRATLTNGYQRTLPLPPVTVRLPPRNDHLADAIRITEFPWTSPVVSAAGAGSEPGEPPGQGAAPTHSVWWTWTPAFDGVVVAYGRGVHGGAASVAVFEGTEMSALRRVNSSASLPLRLAARAGSPLSFQLTPNPGLGGHWEFQFALLPQLPGDDFASRTELPVADGVFPLPVGPSSTEPGEPLVDGRSVVPSLWWTWNPPGDGTLILRGEVQHSGDFIFVPEWRAFAGATLETLTPLPPVVVGFESSQDPGVAFPVRGGEPVQIAGSMLHGTNVVTEARLEFVPHPSPGTIGRPVRTRLWFGSSISFPVTAMAGEQVIIEVSTDLATWSPIRTQNFEQSGTAWLGPFSTFEEAAFFRAIRQAIPPLSVDAPSRR